MRPRDPHRFVNDLDSQTIGRLVDRLENRGRDAVFTRLFDQYAATLEVPPGGRVLELGCGTGVVTRALARRADFRGTVLGIDQSAEFIEVAKAQAESAGCAETASFRVGDAHGLEIEPGSFDVVIAHTLISHVTSPETVLREAARALRSGGRLVVFDGDYASLTYDYPDEVLARRMNEALANATFNNPMIMRALPRLFGSLGFRLTRSYADVVAEVGEASYFRSFAQTYVPFVKRSGLVDPQSVDTWFDAQLSAMDDGSFFASCNYYTYVAQRVVALSSVA
ncbi:MAG: methyltransferase domain-containing protein [Gammaproteobacteria bacterium]|nr:methyltransferase domain-containing protein [Gammaproteobacteria bacterium]